MTTTNDKLRSVLLSALMVMSVFAGATAFAGTAAANHSDDSVADSDISSGDRFWQGEVLHVVPDSGTDETWELHRVNDASDNDTSFVSEFTTNDDVITIDTDGRESGDYVILNGNNNYVQFKSDGTVDDAGDLLQSAQWSLANQEFSVSASSTNVTNADDASADTTLTFDSNRGQYNVVVTADGLDYEQLDQIFTADSTSEDDDSVTLEDVSGEVDADFTEISADSYDINFDVADTSAEDDVTINVSEPAAGEITLPNNVISEQRGDVAEFTVNLENTDTAYLQIGDTGSNFVSRVQIDASDSDSDEVTIEFHTAQVTEESDPTNFIETSTDDVSITADGDYEGVWTGGDIDLSEDRDGDGPQADQLSNPIAAGTYDIVAYSDESFENREDKTNLGLNERSTDDIQTYVHNDNLPSDDAVEELLSGVSESDTIAQGDAVVVQVEASGIYDSIASADDFNSLNDGAGNNQGVYLNLTETNAGPNAVADQVGATEAAGSYFDADNNTFYLAFLTDETDLDQGENYEANFFVSEQNAFTADDENVSTEFSVAEPTVELSNLNDEDELELPNSENATVEGTSNFAPGTDVDVEIESANNFWSTGAEIDENGEFNATFDLSDVENGSEVTVTASVGSVDDSATAQVFEGAGDGDSDEETTTEEDDTETTTTEETETTTTEETTTTTEEDEDTTTTEEENDGGIPGFGISVALVALLAAALLALRRSN